MSHNMKEFLEALHECDRKQKEYDDALRGGEGLVVNIDTAEKQLVQAEESFQRAFNRATDERIAIFVKDCIRAGVIT